MLIEQDKLAPIGYLEELAEKFEGELSSVGIQVESGSPLERGILALTGMKEIRSGNIDARFQSRTTEIRESIGYGHLIRLAMNQRGNSDFHQLVPHLRLLNVGQAAQTVTDNDEPRATDVDASNKLFELIVALGVMDSATDLRMDDPSKSSGGKNPDVLAKMRDGKLWGFACKSIHGDNPDSLFDNISKAVQQIENSPAEIGIVVLSLKNKLPHGQLLPEFVDEETGEILLGVHRDYHDAVVSLEHYVSGIFKNMVDHCGSDNVWGLFRSRKALPGVLTFVSTTIGVQSQVGAIPTLLGHLQLVQMEFSPLVLPSRFPPEVMEILNDLNRGLWPPSPGLSASSWLPQQESAGDH